ncbi:polysaccharide deacetylase family protein [Bacillus sp. FJAT-29790]|uniref:polysaccharide deacetylase family protein n=1 Tax=Bacillus sp. FJAT-29790 TaxID=1895002 RepID=UPI001C23A6CA|nr:polysaccharide deacetylase family protein [Bacillus sp. FJAT-29790]MBU8880338.1 polysaccharide deacetylase family protein [Bacillus sp. FJAT-29790]
MENTLIYQGDSQSAKISLMVNVAWGNEYLMDLLKILEDYQIHLTFFLEGRWVENNSQFAQMIRMAGHEIGNHAYSHPNMLTLSKEEITNEITRTNDVIEENLKIKPAFFTPPFGYFDQRVIEIAAKEKMKTILWSLDTLDWKLEDHNEIINRIVPKLQNGSIILMHPTKSSLEALPIILNHAADSGLKVCTISELLHMRGE